jgi:hypothetical protein
MSSAHAGETLHMEFIIGLVILLIVLSSLWRGMRALERMADSLAQIQRHVANVEDLLRQPRK